MKTACAVNRLTNQVVSVPRDHLNHVGLGKNLDEVRSPKPRARLSEIVKDSPKDSARRVTNVATPDKNKDKD